MRLQFTDDHGFKLWVSLQQLGKHASLAGTARPSDLCQTPKMSATYGADKGFNSAPMGNNGNPNGGVRPTPSTDSNEVMVGLVVPLGSGRVLASFTRKNDKMNLNQDARAWGVGYLYAVLKRTDLYAVYGAITNENGAGYTVVNSSNAGTGNRASNLGIRHAF